MLNNLNGGVDTPPDGSVDIFTRGVFFFLFPVDVDEERVSLSSYRDFELISIQIEFYGTSGNCTRGGRSSSRIAQLVGSWICRYIMIRLGGSPELVASSRRNLWSRKQPRPRLGFRGPAADSRGHGFRASVRVPLENLAVAMRYTLLHRICASGAG